MSNEKNAGNRGESEPNSVMRIGSQAEDFRLAMESVEDYAIFMLDPGGSVATWNRGAARLKGYSAEEIVGQHFSRFYPPEAVKAGYPLKELEAAAQSGRFEDEGWRLRKDKTRFWANVVITCLRDEKGQIRGYAKVTRDLTERKLAEEKLRASEARLRRVVEASFVGIFFWDRSGRITDANDAFLAIGGYSRQDLKLGRLNWASLIEATEPGGQVQWRQLANLTGQGVVSELLLVDATGREVPVLVGVSRLEADGDWGVAFVVDITLRKRNELELSHARDELEKRVAERTRDLELANVELRAAKEQADAANLAKSNFLSRMSHELRTPLNAILGFGYVLSLQDLNQKNKSSVRYIVSAGEHLLKLINEVLDIARVESGTIELSVEPVSVGQVVADVIGLLEPLAEQNKVTLDDSALKARETFVMADEQRLKQVIINLISNGIKYNRQGGKVSVQCGVLDRKVRIWIKDTGIGIAAENFHKLFMPFERLTAANSPVEGTGLGLMLSRRLTEAMGGTIGLESVQGEGSRFYVELPEATAGDESLLGRVQWGVQEKNGPARACILAIEDNSANFKLLEAILSYRPGVELIGAIQGRIGLELASSRRPDLILLDLHLPDMRGEDVLLALKHEKETAEIPVIIVSADASPGRVHRLISLGAKAYVTKPLRMLDLLELVDEYVGDSRPPD